MGTLGGLDRSYNQDPYISPQSSYGYARHLGTIDRPSYVLPRIRIPEGMRSEDGMRSVEGMGSADLTLSPISFHIPRINSGETASPYSVNYVPQVGPVYLPPVPPSVTDVDEYYGKHVNLPQGAILADPQLVPAEPKNVEEKALNDNTALSFQTILFALLRYPALICVFFAASSLWGRGMNVKKVQNEFSTGMAAFCSGAALLLLSLLLLSDHRNCYLRAQILAWSRHIVGMLGVGGAVVTIVFAAMTIEPLQKQTDAECATSGCLSHSERLVQLAVLIGASSLVLMMALFALVMGCVGVYQMKSLLEHEKKASVQPVLPPRQEIFHF